MSTSVAYSDSRYKVAADSLPGAPRDGSDTLNDVNKDETRRNKLIDDNNLLKGIRMTSSGPQPSTRDLIVRPVKPLNVNVDQSATIETTTVEAEFTETLMQSNYNSVSVKVSAPYVTASADYSKETSYKNTETEKTIMVSSRYLFPQGSINFSSGAGFGDDIQLSPAFLQAINTALGKPTKSEQRESLDAVFKDYGDVFRTKIEIGGTLSAHTMETFKRSESETTVKEDVKGGLEVAVKGWGTGASAGHGNTQQTITTSQGRKLSVKYIVEGGDYTLIQETARWIASTNNSAYWRVIEVTDTIPIVDLLPDPIKKTVKDLLTPLLGRWVSVTRVPGTERYPVSIYRPRDVIPAGWFWLGHTTDSSRALIVKPTFGPKAGRNYAVSTGRLGTGFSDQPFPNLSQFAFFSTIFGGFTPNVAPGTELGALRPGLFIEGKWELHGTSIDSSVYVTLPPDSHDPADDCFDLKPVIRVKQTGSDNPPRPRWALRKSVVLFDSE